MENIEKVESVRSICIIDNIKDVSSKFTIAIPTYKRVDTLKFALESVTRQVNAPLYHIIVVDNNPDRNDDTERYMMSTHIPNLRYYKNQQNVGMVGNWNKLYLLSITEWVVMLHDDDILADNFLEIINSLIQKRLYEFDVISPSFVLKKERNFFKVNDISYKYKSLGRIDFCFLNPIGAPLGLTAKREFVLRNKGFSDLFYPSLDYYFYYQSSEKGKICKLKGQGMGYYVIGENESLKDTTIADFVYNRREIGKLVCEQGSVWMKILSNIMGPLADLNMLYWFNPSEEQLSNRRRLLKMKKSKIMDPLKLRFYDHLCKLIFKKGWIKIK